MVFFSTTWKLHSPQDKSHRELDKSKQKDLMELDVYRYKITGENLFFYVKNLLHFCLDRGPVTATVHERKTLIIVVLIIYLKLFYTSNEGLQNDKWDNVRLIIIKIMSFSYFP